jgi:hypothetical protein
VGQNKGILFKCGSDRSGGCVELGNDSTMIVLASSRYALLKKVNARTWDQKEGELVSKKTGGMAGEQE